MKCTCMCCHCQTRSLYNYWNVHWKPANPTRTLLLKWTWAEWWDTCQMYSMMLASVYFICQNDHSQYCLYYRQHSPPIWNHNWYIQVLKMVLHCIHVIPLVPGLLMGYGTECWNAQAKEMYTKNISLEVHVYSWVLTLLLIYHIFHSHTDMSLVWIYYLPNKIIIWYDSDKTIAKVYMVRCLNAELSDKDMWQPVLFVIVSFFVNHDNKIGQSVSRMQ